MVTLVWLVMQPRPQVEFELKVFGKVSLYWFGKIRFWENRYTLLEALNCALAFRSLVCVSAFYHGLTNHSSDGLTILTRSRKHRPRKRIQPGSGEASYFGR